MKAEAPNFKIVDNEPGWGHFVLRLLQGTSRTETVVPAIYFTHPDQEKAYYSAGFASGHIVEAVRFGKRGLLGFWINPDVSSDTTLKLWRESTVGYSRKFREEVFTRSVLGHEHYVDSIDTMIRMGKPNVVVTGAFQNQPFQAELYYVPSAE